MTNGLLISYTEDNGSPHPSSYWEFDRFEVKNMHDGADASTQNTQTVFKLRGWHDKASHDVNLPALDAVKEYPLPLGPIVPTTTVGDAITGLYAYVVATDPTFAGATTV